jgi:isoaspartyl peptidase/L-asparaginase-like protein (Ntn-hydrolase superfamily)
VLLAGDGAEKFARDTGCSEIVPNSFFDTLGRKAQYEHTQNLSIHISNETDKNNSNANPPVSSAVAAAANQYAHVDKSPIRGGDGSSGRSTNAPTSARNHHYQPHSQQSQQQLPSPIRELHQQHLQQNPVEEHENEQKKPNPIVTDDVDALRHPHFHPENENLPRGWEAELDPNTGKTFYIDHNTKTTSWIHPLKMTQEEMTQHQQNTLISQQQHQQQVLPASSEPDHLENTQRDDEHQHQQQQPISTGTVGVVCLDVHGNLAAATSSGGLTNKPPGRVADTGIIGCGTYAHNDFAAVSCAGSGEILIRVTAGHNVVARMRFGRQAFFNACDQVIFEDLAGLGGVGGMVACDPSGNVAMPFSSTAMPRGFVQVTGEPRVAVLREPLKSLEELAEINDSENQRQRSRSAQQQQQQQQRH